MGYGSISQIVLVILSVVVIVTYVQPKFEDMQVTQSEISKYQEAVDKASQFNARLDQLLDIAGQFSQSDLQALEEFLPDDLDEVAVAEDIQTIAQQNQVVFASIAFGDAAGATDNDRNSSTDDGTLESDAAAQLVATEFEVTVLGAYDDFKNFLTNLEKNSYPLEVVSLGFEAVADSESESINESYEYTLGLETYSLKPVQN